MNYTNDNMKKICNFYMSDWHFTVMILPYINKEINKGTKVITIFERDIEEKVKTLVEKLNLKNKNEILKINWKHTSINEFTNDLEKNLKSDAENLLIINGTNCYIDAVNEKINVVKSSGKIPEKKIKIINCYDFDSNKEEMSDILKKHDGILNTSGESKIENLL